MKKTFFFIAGIVMPVLFLGAQQNIYKPLSPGDKVPEQVLENLISVAGQGKQLKAAPGKLMIIDFWATWCSACIGGFPKMQKMQEIFGDQLQVVLVNAQQTKDTKEKIASTVAQFQKSNSLIIYLPMISGDSILQQLFPHKYLPHIVWIDQKGRFMQGSFADEVNEKNIRAMLDGEQESMHMKKDSLEYDFNKPLFYSAADSSLITYRSWFTPYIEGLGFNSGQLVTGTNYSKYTTLNYPMENYYRRAFPEELSLPVNQLYFPQDAETFKAKYFNRHDYNNKYCYELILPDSINDNQLIKILRAEVGKAFGYSVKKVKVNTPAIIVKTQGTPLKIPPLTQGAKSMRIELFQLFQYFNEVSDIPVIDSTGIPQNQEITLLLPAEFYQFSRQQLINYIQAFGFVTTQEYKIMPFAVFFRTPF